MKKQNPWLQIPYADYEAHMSHPQVEQLQQLNLIIADKMKQYQSKCVCVAGAGNGFEHLSECDIIYAVDINHDYLTACRERYGQYGDALKCIRADMGEDTLPIPGSSVDLVICHLILEYAGVGGTMRAIRDMLKTGGVVNVVIQENGGSSFVSPSPVSSLSVLSGFGVEVAGEAVIGLDGFRVLSCDVYNLANGRFLKVMI